MTTKQYALLVLLGAIWGSTFIFLKLITPVFGPIFGTSFQLLSAAGLFFIYFKIKGEKIEWKNHFFKFALIGLTNSALPFILFSVAALYIPANLSSILYSTSPVFGLIFGIYIVKEKVTTNKVLGLLLGTIGVVVVSYGGFVGDDAIGFLIGTLACLTATSLYGLAGSLIQKYSEDIDLLHLVYGTILIGALLILPFGFLAPIEAKVSLLSIFYVVIFGFTGTAIAYLIYFKLNKEVGPVKALMVTYLSPVFGIFWSVVLLKETVELLTVIGLLVIFSGIYVINLKTKVIQNTN